MIDIAPRSTIGTPEPPSSRTRIPVPCSHLLVHYTGAGTYGDGRKSDLDEAKAIAAYGVNNGKTWEYNYLVGWQGNAYEQAGEYQGAHCKNFNSQSMGILCILGIGITPSQAMIDAFRQVRQQFVDEGRLTGNHECVPHYRYRATSCCAQLAEPPGISWNSPTGEGSLGNLIPALLEPWTSPYVPTEDDRMAPLYFKSNTGQVWALDPYTGATRNVSGQEWYDLLNQNPPGGCPILTEDQLRGIGVIP